MKQYLRGYDLASFGLGDPKLVNLAQQGMRASRRFWSQHGASRRADLATRKIFSRQGRFLIAPIPKVGTKTLKVMLQNLGADPASDIDIAFIHKPLHLCLDGIDEDFTIFSMVRNPWSRALSCYRNKIITSRIGEIAIRSRYNGLSPTMSFTDFIHWLDSEEGRDEIADRHWISQTLLLTDPGSGKMLCTQIAKFERFEADIQAFLDKVGLGHVAIPHINRTAGSSDPHSYRAAYNEETRKIIERRYHLDIETFDYDF